METKTGRARTSWPAALACALVVGTWVATPRAQEMSVLLQSVETIERRLNKVEAELQGIRKSSAAAREKVPSVGPESQPNRVSADSLSAILDLLATRVASLEAARGSLVPGSAAGLDMELGSLAREVKGLAEAVAAAKATTPATASNPAPASVPPTPKPPEIAAVPSGPGIALSGNVQIHGERKFTTASERDNLDLFWGRINIGLDFKDERLQSKINVRIFPEGFGFDPLTSVAYDTGGQGSIKAQSEPQAKVQINNAWVRYSWTDQTMRVGRIEMHDGPSESYGYYLDVGPGGKFMSRKPGSGHNALEFTGRRGVSTTSMILAAADKKLNRGYLRLQQKFSLPQGWQVDLGYRSNVFDQWRFPDEEILHRYDATLAYSPRKGMLIFAEAAVLQIKNRSDDDIPLLAGVQFPIGPYADLVSLEAEFLSTRKVVTGKKTEAKALILNAYGRKKFWKRLNFEAGLFSDATRADAAAIGIGLRVTSGIK